MAVMITVTMTMTVIMTVMVTMQKMKSSIHDEPAQGVQAVNGPFGNIFGPPAGNIFGGIPPYPPFGVPAAYPPHFGGFVFDGPYPQLYQQQEAQHAAAAVPQHEQVEDVDAAVAVGDQWQFADDLESEDNEHEEYWDQLEAVQQAAQYDQQRAQVPAAAPGAAAAAAADDFDDV
jgi:hypothetical protein